MPVNPFSTFRAQQHDVMISIVAGSGGAEEFPYTLIQPPSSCKPCVAIQQVRGDQMPRIRDCFLTGLINYSAQAYP